MQRRIAATTAALALALITVGCDQQAPPPADVAKIVALQAPTLVTQGKRFDVDAYAEDLTSTEYAVIYRIEQKPAGLQLADGTCDNTNGTFNPDGHWCEYGAPLRTISKSTYRFVWHGAKAAQFNLEFCAMSFTKPPQPTPYGGDCVTKDINVAP